MAPTKIKYKALDHSNPDLSFRLAILQPGPRTAYIRLDLEHTTLSARPTYEALSYTWGKESPVKPIDINGTRTQVRENLWYALANLRNVNDSRRLWIDAICINQEDDDEKNNQVRLMAEIFYRAEQVLVWLGENLSSSHAGVRYALAKPGTLDKTNLEITGMDQKTKNPPNTTTSQWNKSGLSDLANLSSPSQESVASSKSAEYHDLCGRPYWNRLWIVQEILAAEKLTVHWGQDSAPWDSFFAQLRDVNPPNAELPFKLAKQREGRYGDSLRLLNLMDVCQDSLCAEPRDKIYGFVGIAHDCQDDSLPVDYKKSLFEVYEDVVRFHSKSAGRDPPHPYLVFVSQLVQKLLGGSIKMNTDLLHRNRHTLQPVTKMEDLERVLETSSISAGEIIEVGPTFKEIIAASPPFRYWKATLTKSAAPDKESLRRMNAEFTRVLLKLHESDFSKITPIRTAVTWEVGKEKDNSTYLLGIDREEEPDSQVPPKSQDSQASNCRLFLTSDFFIGLGPPNVLKGDHLVQFQRSDAVAVVREIKSPVTADTYHRRVVGRAAMANKTYNEAMNFHVPGVSEDLTTTDGNETPIYVDIPTLNLLTQ